MVLVSAQPCLCARCHRLTESWFSLLLRRSPWARMLLKKERPSKLWRFRACKRRHGHITAWALAQQVPWTSLRPEGHRWVQRSTAKLLLYLQTERKVLPRRVRIRPCMVSSGSPPQGHYPRQNVLPPHTWLRPLSLSREAPRQKWLSQNFR